MFGRTYRKLRLESFCCEPGLYLTLVRWWPGYMSAPHTYVTDRLCVVSLVHRIMMG